MRNKIIAFCLATAIAASVMAGTKDSGTSVLKDVQPVGTTDKHHKNQQYDLFFASSSGKDYTCRTSDKTSLKATDLAVGSNLTYQVKDNKAKLKITGGKELSCTIVRVANVPADSNK